jgi:hydrogenase maturation protease
MPPSAGTVLVIAIGNEFRRDDGVGPAVLRQLRDLIPPGVDLVLTDGEPARLVEAWTGAALAIVVDAVRVVSPHPEPPHPEPLHKESPHKEPLHKESPHKEPLHKEPPHKEPPQPGRVHRFVLDRPRAGTGRAASSHGLSSHGLGLDDAIGLALALDRMPGRLIVHAIEAADLSQGPGLTPEVAAAVDPVASAILDDLRAVRG